MYDALTGANSVLERDIISLLLATLDPQALLDAGRLSDYEAALRFAHFWQHSCTSTAASTNSLACLTLPEQVVEDLPHPTLSSILVYGG